MTNERKKIFIETVEALFNEKDNINHHLNIFISQDAIDFFEDYKKGNSGAKTFTEKGIAILKEMREINDWISAKSLGEKMDISGRSASSTMRKLVLDGYIEKKEDKPASYKITDKGMTCEFDIEEN